MHIYHSDSVFGYTRVFVTSSASKSVNELDGNRFETSNAH